MPSLADISTVLEGWAREIGEKRSEKRKGLKLLRVSRMRELREGRDSGGGPRKEGRD